MNSKSINKIVQFLFKIPEFRNWKEILAALAKDQKPTRVILKNGVQIDAPDSSSLLRSVRRVFFKQMYNPPPLSIETNDTVVDIGANIGVFTVFAAYKTQNTVYAFEPFPENCEFLNRNIRTNRLHNVRTHAVAVGDKVGREKLFVGESSTGHSLSNHFVQGNRGAYVEVPTMTLQQIMDENNLEQIDFLKLDCEGAEGAIFQSTPKEYLQRVRKIAMEFHDYASPLKHDEIEKMLIEAGFTTKLNWDRKKPSGYLYGLKS